MIIITCMRIIIIIIIIIIIVIIIIICIISIISIVGPISLIRKGIIIKATVKKVTYASPPFFETLLT